MIGKLLKPLAAVISSVALVSFIALAQVSNEGGGGGTASTSRGFLVPASTTAIYYATDYGSALWNGSSSQNVGPSLNAAYAACGGASTPGGYIVIPAGTYYVATALINSWSGCKTVGAGVSTPRDDDTTFKASTRLIWNGANNATFATWAATSTTTLYDAGVEGVLFDCNAVCNIAFKATQISFSRWRLGVAEGLLFGAEFLTNAAGNSPGNQHNRGQIFARHTATSDNKTVGTVSNSHPVGILWDGNTAWNTSINYGMTELYAWYNSGDGIVFGNTDENEWGLVRAYPEAGVLNGRPIVMANSIYVMSNGVAVNNSSYHNRIIDAEAPVYLLGYNTGIVVANGVHVGTGVYNPVTIATNATTANLNKILHFASTTGIVAGQVVDCGSGSNMYRDTIITSVAATTLTMLDENYGLVPSGINCTAKVGITSQGVAGVYTITATNATTFSIAVPAGGHVQSGIVIASGAITFTDLVLPLTGTPNAGDTWTVTVPASNVYTTVMNIDRNNSVAMPMAQPGGNIAMVRLSTGSLGIGTNPMPSTPGSLNVNSGLYDAGAAPTGTAGTGYVRATAGTLTSPTLTDPIDQGFLVSTSTLTATSNTAFAVIPGLSVNLTAGKTYNCRGHLSGVSGAAGGLKVTLATSNTLSATTTRWRGFTWNAGTPVSNVTVTALNGNIAGSNAIYSDVDITGSITVNVAGTLAVWAAQNTSDPTSTTVLQGSTFSCTRVN